MIAFVLSGGGSRGAFEVGALRALLLHGIRPDMLVGSSAGAVNAAGLALEPTLVGIHHLHQLWLSMDEDDFYAQNPFTTALRLMLKKASLYSNQRMYRLVRKELDNRGSKFAEIKKTQLFLTAVDLGSGKLHIFGDDPSDSLVDAIMASTAIQPYFAPWNYRGRVYADGGLISNLPLLAALERGATEIYALDVTVGVSEAGLEQDLLGILRQEVFLVLDQMRKQELRQARARLGNRLHHFHYTRFPGLMPFDFSHTRAMIADGERMLSGYLNQRDRDQNRIRKWLKRRRPSERSATPRPSEILRQG